MQIALKSQYLQSKNDTFLKDKDTYICGKTNIHLINLKNNRIYFAISNIVRCFANNK